MLLTNRRLGLLLFCLAGMEIAWITPFFLLFYRPVTDMSPWVVFVGLFGSLLAFMLILEILNLLQVDWPYYELAVIGLILVTSLLFVRFWLYRDVPLGNFRWLGNALGALFDFQQGIRPEVMLILTSVLLWQRAANATSRDVGFFGVGVSFRLGLLLLILGASILSLLKGQDTRPILWLYLAMGLTAVAVARVHEKASDAWSAGSPPVTRVSQAGWGSPMHRSRDTQGLSRASTTRTLSASRTAGRTSSGSDPSGSNQRSRWRWWPGIASSGH